MYFLLDTSADAAAEFVAAVAANLPVGTSLGRIRAVTPTALLADYDDGGAVYGIDSAGDTWRAVEIDDGAKYEFVTWRGGHELDRELRRGSPPPMQSAVA